jgi:predicted DNA-binding transcriptional regulator AlpA
MKRFLRKKAVADRYGIHQRTVERMAMDGRLPKPIYRGKFPLWDTDALDESDRVAALLPRPTQEHAA